MKNYLILFLLFFTTSGYCSLELKAGFFLEKNKIQDYKETDSFNYRYYKGKSNPLGLFAAVYPAFDLPLSEKFLFCGGPFLEAGFRKYKELPPEFTISDSYFTKAGLDFRIKFQATPKLKLFLSSSFGFMIEWINWKYTYMINAYPYPTYDQNYKELVYRQFYSGSLGIEIKINPLIFLFGEGGIQYGQFSSQISETSLVEGSPKKSDWGLFAKGGIGFKLK